MLRRMLTLFALALLVAAPRAEAFELWNQFRSTANDPDGNVLVRVEQEQEPGDV